MLPINACTKKLHIRFFIAFFLSILMVGNLQAQEEGEEKKVAESPELIEKGKKIYDKRCIYCHGEKGDAKAPATPRSYPEPRDFTNGIFKIKNTPRGELATDQDIFKVITKGMPGTSMPAWPEISNEERWGLVYYIKSFSDRFKKGKAPAEIKVGTPIPSSPDSIEKGGEIFTELECDMCHGEGGRGDGFKALKMKTKWGTRILPRDLSRKWTFRRGHAPEDVYRTVRIGVEGTPMPSFATVLDNPVDDDEDEDEEFEEEEDGHNTPAVAGMSGEERTWHLVNYVLSLSPAERIESLAAYQVKLEEGPLPDSPDDKKWDSVVVSEYRLSGQITIDPRLFRNRIDFVQLRALHNKDEIAFLLTWHDPSKMTKTTKDGKFADSVAIQLPQNPDGQKPYFLNGDPDNPTYLLKWSADDEGGITEFNATGMTRMVAQEKGKQSAKGKIVFDKGEYRLLIKRPLTGDEKDTPLIPGKLIPIAFNAWEGSNGETGTKRSVSSWSFLILEAELPKEIFYYPILVILFFAGLELVIIWWVRKSRKEVSSS